MTSTEIRAVKVNGANSLGRQIDVVIEIMIEIAAQLAEANERETFVRVQPGNC